MTKNIKKTIEIPKKTYNDEFVKYILNFIKNDDNYSKIFSHHNQKHSIEDLISGLIYKLNTGISYNNFFYKNINGAALHYFYKKLIKLDFLNIVYEKYISKYTIEMAPNIKELHVDSTLIANKCGIDLVDYNVQLKKHKSSKISLIVDDYGVLIDVEFTSSRNHDALICDKHIDNIKNKLPHLCTSDKILIADAAYDSNNIRKKLKDNNIGILVCDHNCRNTKNPEKLKKNNLYHKMLLKKRSKVEHLNNKIKKK
jgi:hypothetical protein